MLNVPCIGRNILFNSRFAKKDLYTHSFKTHFSLPAVSYINALTAHVFNTAEVLTVLFHSGIFLKPV